MTPERLKDLVPPVGDETYFPVSHVSVYENVKKNVKTTDWERLITWRTNNVRLFCVLETAQAITPERSVIVAFTNSYDMALSRSLLLGTKYGDNVSLGEKYCSYKNTKGGSDMFAAAVVGLVAAVKIYAENEYERTQRYSRDFEKYEDEAILLRLYEQKIFSSREMPVILKNWRESTSDKLALFDLCVSAMMNGLKNNPSKFIDRSLALREVFDA